MICEYCQGEWFPARFHPGCCSECGGPRLRSAPQGTDRHPIYALYGERVEIDWTIPGGVVHLPPGGVAEVICPEVEGKTMREVLSETFPYQTWNAMSNALMMWRPG